MAANLNSTSATPIPANRVYSDYQFTQMVNVIIPMMLACPKSIIAPINHDVRQLFTDNGVPLFGDKERGWKLHDAAEMIADIKLNRYAPIDPLFTDCSHMALMWGGAQYEGRVMTFEELAREQLSGQSDHDIARTAFWAEFERWLDWSGKCDDYAGRGQS